MIAVTEITLNLKCDCHHTQTMARVVDGMLFITLKTHGDVHTLRTPLDKLAEQVLVLQPKQ